MIHGSQIVDFILKEDDDLDSLLSCLSKKVFVNRQSGFALVSDSNGKLTGVVTDADIRKFLLINKRMPSEVGEVANRKFISVTENLPNELWPSEIAKQMSSRGWTTNYPVRFVPIVNQDSIPIGIIDTQDFEREIEKLRDQVIVVGLGYVGLTVALAMADSEMQVVGFDRDEIKVNQLLAGVSPLYEQGLDEVLSNRLGINLTFQTNFVFRERGSGQAAVYVICLPTPLDTKTKQLDLSYIESLLEVLVPVLNQGDCVVLRSTVPLGTGRRIVENIERKRSWKVGSDFYYVQAPERTVEGDALREIRELPQIIGGATPACLDRGLKLFADVAKLTLPVSSIETAEMVKLAGNAFRDYSFAFANKLSEVARSYNVDVDEVIHKSNLNYPRSTIPAPSPGVGGPCLTKDPYLFGNQEEENSPILSARLYNECVPIQLVDFLNSKIKNRQSGLTIGLAFKGTPPTDDLRNSTNMYISQELSKYFKNFATWDAVVDLSQINYGLSEKEILERPGFDFIGILNNHTSNALLVRKILIKTDLKEITIFDPWRAIDLNSCVINKKVVSVNYITMSMAKTWHQSR